METCVHVHPKTARRCRLPVSSGQSLCGAHNPGSIPCPKCTTPVPAASLARHLSKPLCPVEKQLLVIRNSPYYRHNINVPHPLTKPNSLTPRIPVIEPILLSLLPAKHVKPTRHELLPENDYIFSAWSNLRDHTLKMQPKHFYQIASLSSLLLTPCPTTETHIIELAAGRAYTSLYLAHILKLRNIPCTVTAVDRAANRHKADRTLRAWAANPSHSLRAFERLRVDLAHLHLSAIQGLRDGDIRIIAKHACGSALDLALLAATNLAKVWKGHVQLVLASCCRNLCSYQALGDGGQVWRNRGVSEELFGQVCKAAQWGLDESHNEEKVHVGSRCRLLIDHTRVTWLCSVGWDAHLTTYTDASPENACIVGVWKGATRNNQSSNNALQTGNEQCSSGSTERV